MKFSSTLGMFCVTILSLSSCAITPTPAKPVEPFTQQPGDVTFNNTNADIMYEILVAELATQRGMPEIASMFYLDAAKQSNDPRIASRAVRVANFANNKEEALSAARIWHSAEPDNPETQRVLAILYLRNGKHEEAQALLSQLLNKDPANIARNLLLTGALLQRESSKEDALIIASHLVALYPLQAESHFVHASLAIQAGKKVIALSSIKKALDIRPDWTDAAILYPRILQENGEKSLALSFLTKYIKNNPAADALRLAYARVLVDEQKLEEARAQFELLAVRMPNNPDVLFALAMIAMQAKEIDDAQKYLLQLSNNGKANSQIHYYLGQIAEQKNDYSTALRWYSKIRNGDFLLESQLRIGYIIAKTKTINDARAHLQNIETKNAKEAKEVILFEGNLLRDLKYYQAAFDFYTKQLNKHSNDIDFLYYRSLVAERLGLVDTVVSDLTYVINKEPNNAAALNALGYTLADKTERLNEALSFIQRANKLEPNDPAIIDSLGWINFRLGNYKTALKYLEQAMKQINDGEVAAHYGEILWTMGKKDDAINVWRKAKEEFKENDVLKETLKRFGQ